MTGARRPDYGATSSRSAATTAAHLPASNCLYPLLEGFIPVDFYDPRSSRRCLDLFRESALARTPAAIPSSIVNFKGIALCSGKKSYAAAFP